MSFAETPSQDEDKWRLRERMIGRIGPLKQVEQDKDGGSGNLIIGDGFPPLFRPRPAAPVKRTLLQKIRWRIATLFGAVPRGVNDNLNWTAERLSLWQKSIWNRKGLHTRVTRPLVAFRDKLFALLRHQLHLRRADLLLIPSAVAFFILPLVLLVQFDPVPSHARLITTLIGTTLLMSILIGPRFGTIATASATVWLSYKILPAASDLSITASLLNWGSAILITATMAAFSFLCGSASLLLRNLFQLGRQAATREADIEAFQSKLRRTQNTESILSYIVAYCRDQLGRRAIFLALDESSDVEPQDHVDIGTQLKSAGYARVVVNRQAYLPRAIKSFQSSGFEPFPLETPSGVIALLGLETANGKTLSALDRRYLKLLLVTAAYALERISLTQKLSALEESQIEIKTRNTALLNLIANIANTTHNLDDQTHGLKQLLDREPSRPYETAINFIRRNISALRNSIALMRDVAS